jgi:hypothetical protein
MSVTNLPNGRHYDYQHFHSENGKAKALKISTLAKLCAALDCNTWRHSGIQADRKKVNGERHRNYRV